MGNERGNEAPENGGDSPGWAPPSTLYLHIPFCPYKCPYCDFVTYVGSRSMIEPYIAALCREIEAVGARALRPHLRTVYFGGGTPGLLTPQQIGRVLQEVDASFSIDATAEISLEANPGEVDAAKLGGFRSAGVTRLSLGAQSLHDRELRALGRGHGAAQVETTLMMARYAGFESVSLDLIYGIPKQTLGSWESTLKRVVDLAPDHVSLYSLIVEPGTVFKRLETRGDLALPPDDEVADMYDVACGVLNDAGYAHYEVANWAQPGHQCVHNLGYWHDDEFLAAGVGAYDYLRPYRSARVRSTKRYVEAMERGEDGIVRRDHVGPLDERFEMVSLGLRLLGEGVAREDYTARFGESIDSRYGDVLVELKNQGFLEDDGRVIRLREKMVVLANEAWERFLPSSEAA